MKGADSATGNGAEEIDSLATGSDRCSHGDFGVNLPWITDHEARHMILPEIPKGKPASRDAFAAAE